jgi:hypothetical protein
METRLESARGRLAGAGFAIEDDVAFEGATFRLVARRTRFERSKFGFAEHFFTLAEFDRLTLEDLRGFSTHAYRCAKKRRKIPLPCGLFESAFSYAVAITKHVDERTLEALRSEAPRKHWASAEIPVVYEAPADRLTYFEKTPMWGAAYYAGFRNQIQRFLGGDGAARP